MDNEKANAHRAFVQKTPQTKIQKENNQILISHLNRYRNIIEWNEKNLEFVFLVLETMTISQ